MSDRTKAYLILAATAVYVVCPIDLVIDLFPGVGQIDDVLITILGWRNAKPLFAVAPGGAISSKQDEDLAQHR